MTSLQHWFTYVNMAENLLTRTSNHEQTNNFGNIICSYMPILTSLDLLLLILVGPFRMRSVVSKMSVFSPLSSEFRRLLLGFFTIFGNGF